MRLHLFSFTLYFCGIAFLPTLAFGKLPVIDPALRYEVPVRSPQPQLSGLDQTLSQQGYFRVPLEGDSFSGSINWLNRIYSTDDLKETIFVKSNLRVKKQFINKLYRHKNGYLVHFELPTKKNSKPSTFAFFFLGFESVSKVRRTLTTIKRSFLKSKTARIELNMEDKAPLISFSFLSRAEAAETSPSASNQSCLDGNSYRIEYHGDPRQKPNNVVSTVLKSGWGCTKGLVKGAWDSTGGAAIDLVAGVGKGIWKLVTAPSELWEGVVTSYRNTVNLLSNLNDAISNASSDFKLLPTDQKAKIVCGVVGSLGTAAAIAFLTSGAGTPIFLRALAQALTKIGQATKNTRLVKGAEKLVEKADNLKARRTTPEAARAKKIVDDIEVKHQAKISEARRKLEGHQYNLRMSNGGSGPRDARQLELIRQDQEAVLAASETLSRLNSASDSEIRAALAALDGESKSHALQYAARLGYVALQPCAATKQFRNETVAPSKAVQ
jgi:hypothetical protein